MTMVCNLLHTSGFVFLSGGAGVLGSVLDDTMSGVPSEKLSVGIPQVPAAGF